AGGCRNHALGHPGLLPVAQSLSSRSRRRRPRGDQLRCFAQKNSFGRANERKHVAALAPLWRPLSRSIMAGAWQECTGAWMTRLDIDQPLLVFLGDVTDVSCAKTAFGLRDWAAERCVGQYALPGCTVSTGLRQLT